MVTAIVSAFVAGLLVAGAIAAVKWLSNEDNRTRLRQWLCRHDWQPRDLGGGGVVVIVTPYAEHCPKCGALR